MNIERARSAWWFGLLPGVGAALMPKCPACIAAYLSFFGSSAVVAAVAATAPFLRPVCLAIAAISLVFIVRRVWIARGLRRKAEHKLATWTPSSPQPRARSLPVIR